jgi:hypothetical protein
MPLSRTSAERLMRAIEECGRGLASELPALQAELTPAEFKAIKREIARVISTMDSAISAKVAFEYPDLAQEAAPIAHKLK